GRGASASPRTSGTLELAAGLCLQSLAVEQTSWTRSSASLGKQATGGYPATGASRDAQHFAAGWHTGSTAQTTRKIAWLAKRSAKNTGPTLCGGTQTQTGAKNAAQTGLRASTVWSYVIHSDSLDHSSEMSARVV